MTAITTIRIDHAALPEHFDRARPDTVAGSSRPSCVTRGSPRRPPT